MTDADLARQEWLDERAAVLWIENGWVYGTALLEAHRMWQEKVQRENAVSSEREPRISAFYDMGGADGYPGHGDAPGAISSDGEAGR